MTIETENIQCPDCGAAVRSGASFCFKCGKHFGVGGAGNTSMEPTTAVEPAADPVPEETTSEPDFSETLPDTPAAQIEESEAPAPAAEADAETNTAVKPVGIKPKPQMTSAAALRKKPKPPKEKIEMVWEQPEGTSNPVFVIGTVVIFVLVLVIILIVYFVK